MTYIRWCFFVVFLLTVWIARDYPDEKLHIVFCDVGQGDASLVIKGDFQMLIDTGPARGGVLRCLDRHLPFWDRQIEIFIGSHQQADHIGALGEVEKRFMIKKKWLSSTTGDLIRYGDLYFDTIYPSFDLRTLGSTDPNDLSTVVQLHYGKFAALFTGDIGEDGELAMVDSGVLTKLDILKTAHHGSKFSSSERFLDKVRPVWAVISVGKRNSYGHPNDETLRRFDAVGSRVLRTDKDGEIEFVFDGTGIERR